RMPVSQPSAMATTAHSAATPSPRRSHSPAPSERFMAANKRPPTTTASANDTAAPNAYENSSSVVVELGPLMTAPARMSPRIGPAQGAHSMPVAAPSASDAHQPPFGSWLPASLLP